MDVEGIVRYLETVRDFYVHNFAVGSNVVQLVYMVQIIICDHRYWLFVAIAHTCTGQN